METESIEKENETLGKPSSGDFYLQVILFEIQFASKSVSNESISIAFVAHCWSVMLQIKSLNEFAWNHKCHKR